MAKMNKLTAGRISEPIAQKLDAKETVSLE
jgi:hypothetical protein